MTMGATMHHRGTSTDGFISVDAPCRRSFFSFASRPPPGQGYGGRANEYGRYDAPSGCVVFCRCFVQMFFFSLASRPPPGQGYGERANDYGRYDSPSGYVHRWNCVRQYSVMCVDLRLAEVIRAKSPHSRVTAEALVMAEVLIARTSMARRRHKAALSTTLLRLVMAEARVMHPLAGSAPPAMGVTGTVLDTVDQPMIVANNGEARLLITTTRLVRYASLAAACMRSDRCIQAKAKVTAMQMWQGWRNSTGRMMTLSCTARLRRACRRRFRRKHSLVLPGGITRTTITRHTSMRIARHTGE